MKRFYFDGDLGADFVLLGSEHNHLSNVCRLRVGEEVVVFCGDEFDYIYRIEKITKGGTQMKFVKKCENKCNPDADLTVFVPCIKVENLGFIVQKLNEIGVREIVIFDTERANMRSKDVNLEKLNTVAKQSCKQCGCSIPVRVRIGKLGEISGYAQVVFADERERERRLGDVKIVAGKIAAIIGPEGGFTEAEREGILCVGGVVAVTLGRRILRAETAAIVVAGVLSLVMNI